MMIKKIKKRDGRLVDFEKGKIADAAWKAAQAVGGHDHSQAADIAEEIAKRLEKEYDTRKIPSVDDIQDMTEKVLIEAGHTQTAKAFILYRKKRQELREAKSALGIEDDLKLSFDALKVISQFKLLHYDSSEKLETPRQMLERVAKALAQADRRYGEDAKDVKDTEQCFAQLLVARDVVPNMSILRNAGTDNQQLSDGFVLPVKDDIKSIFDTLRDAAVLHKKQFRGFGLGFSFSTLRAKGSKVGTDEHALGPEAFLYLYDRTLSQMNPYGTNLAFLPVTHPDIMSFLTAKDSYRLRSFGLSVLLTKDFMKAVQEDRKYELVDPANNLPLTQLRARSVFDMLATMAWRTGDPAVVFLDNVNKSPTNTLEGEQIEATTPTGEHSLLPYECSFTASITLSHFVFGNELQWERLSTTVKAVVHMLDNTVDICDYPMQEMKLAMERTRRIGVGLMGWADTLIALGIPYNGPDAIKLAEKVMKFVDTEAHEESQRLAKKRGTFADFKKSTQAKRGERVRNVSCTTIMAAGASSMIADCSQGIEPHFAISYIKHTPTSESLEVIPLFEDIARKEGFHSEELMRKIALAGSLRDIPEVPDRWKKVFVTAADCSIMDHLAVQIAFQKYTDNGVSKTINLPSTATIYEVEEVYKKAYEAGCRSVHVYREGSSSQQLITSRSSGMITKRKKLRYNR